MSGIKNRLVETIDVKEFYKKIYPEWEPGSNVECPNEAHVDTNASFFIHADTGGFQCYGCGVKGTSVVSYVADFVEGSYKKAVKALTKHYLPNVIDDWRVNFYCTELLKDGKKLAALKTVRGWSQETIKRFKIGWSPKFNRVTIPIFVEGGQCEELRLYDPFKIHPDKFKAYGTDLGTGRIFPVGKKESAFSHKTLFIMEGEPDVILARQEGINAISFTGGVQGFSKAIKENLPGRFAGLNVIVCFDNDDAGRTAARKVCNLLRSYAPESIKNIVCPRGKDFTDFIIHKRGSRTEFLKHASDSEYAYSVNTVAETKVALAEASHADNKTALMEVDVIVSGKHMAPYLCPKEVVIKCHPTKEYCAACPCKDDGMFKYTVDAMNERAVSWLIMPEESYPALVKKELGLPEYCRMSANVESVQSVEQVTIIPSINTPQFGAKDSFVTREGFYFGHGIEANGHYTVKTKLEAHPRSKAAIHVFKEVSGTSDSLRNFQLKLDEADEIKQVIHSLSGPGKVEPERVLYQAAEILSRNATNIYGRPDLHIAVDIVFHSPLSFVFDSVKVTKGCIELLLLGDTRCGKGQATERIARFYDLGAVVSGENASFVGLVGGIQKIGGSLQLSWGAIPINNGRLVIIDESSGISNDDLGRMSRVRSEGIAEIDKAGFHAKTKALTRLIWIANPIDGRPMNSYATGVEAVLDLIKKQEDIARFDLVLTVSKGEVPITEINASTPLPYQTSLSTNVAKRLLLWIWSRAESQITFSQRATEAILKSSAVLSSRYSPAIPILMAENARFKIAKMAASIAARCFSTKDNATIFVDYEHVVCATKILIMFYNKPGFGYDLFSKAQASRDRLTNSADLDQVFDMFPKDIRRELIDGLIELKEINAQDLADILDIDRMTSQALIGKMTRCHALKKRNNNYEKRPGFITYLQDKRKVLLNGHVK